MKIAIATDAWTPQVNGVVTTLTRTVTELERLGHTVLLLTPAGRRSVPCPTYPEIRLTLFPKRAIRRALHDFQPDCVHIATEGTIGLAARRYCLQRELPFTTAYHTQFPEYVRTRFPIPIRWTVAWLKWFHGPASRTLVPTIAIRDLLRQRGFDNVVLWSRGVDTDVFNPTDPVHDDLPRPIWVYAGRVAAEKNLNAFLDLDLPGSKLVIGDGPERAELERRYPAVHFVGYRFGRDLARRVAGADVFVFPSKTDTFGLVMLEAMACGLPVAAYPVAGPVDVLEHGVTGWLDDDLARACHAARELDRNAILAHARQQSWRRCTRQFLRHLAPLRPALSAPDWRRRATMRE